MRTGRSLTVCWSQLPGGDLVRGGSGLGGAGCAPGGSGQGGMCLLLGGSARGGLVWGGVLWEVCSGRVCSGGVYPSMYWGRHPFPPVDRQTPVKILPWPNFVAAGNKLIRQLTSTVIWHVITCIRSKRYLPVRPYRWGFCYLVSQR